MDIKFKNYLILITILGMSFILTFSAFAHPGRTASDGCHYCRTNCDSWGVPWNERHCHNVYAKPVSVSLPKSTYEAKSINETKELPSTNSDDQEEGVEAEQDNQSAYTAQIQDKDDDSANWIYLITGIALGGLGLGIIGKIKNKKIR
ncbi:hypothetical protein ACFLZ0_01230 [Patescibacteria group bacterium]